MSNLLKPNVDQIVFRNHSVAAPSRGRANRANDFSANACFLAQEDAAPFISVRGFFRVIAVALALAAGLLAMERAEVASEGSQRPLTVAEVAQ